ncbi:MAG: radical SAM protein [Nitrospinae bacterium]|nr:radical SAM protein [Nitrospinota bacterium]
MTRERLIVPIFIPHEGCPYRCVFCNQRDITGVRAKADREAVEQTLHAYLRTGAPLPAHREAAFYGGSFTGLPQARQEFLLSLAQPWIDSGELHAVRLSTHPLFIDDEKLDLLKRYRVETVELGIQSTDPEVLELSGRPCSLNEIQVAAESIKRKGFNLGLQLMPGLPGDNEETFRKSADDVARMRPRFVRLYPTLVIRGTALHRMYLEKKFVPWDLEVMVERLKYAVLKFNGAGIRIARVGLPPDPSLLENLVAGPFHPALRYLVESRICLDWMAAQLRARAGGAASAIFKVPSKYVSHYTGHRRENVGKLKAMFRLEDVKFVADESLASPVLAC